MGRGMVNQGYVQEEDHHHGHPADANMKNRGSIQSRISEEIIPDLDESGYQPFRQHLVCPYCKRSIITEIQLSNGRRVWITFLMFVVTGFCLIV